MLVVGHCTPWLDTIYLGSSKDYGTYHFPADSITLALCATTINYKQTITLYHYNLKLCIIHPLFTSQTNSRLRGDPLPKDPCPLTCLSGLGLGCMLIGLPSWLLICLVQLTTESSSVPPQSPVYILPSVMPYLLPNLSRWPSTQPLWTLCMTEYMED